MLIRINKFLSDSGVCSRRKADELVKSGLIRVGTEIVKALGVKIDPEKDIVFVNGKKVNVGGEKVYYILNKPIGYVTTASDPHGRKKVTDLVPSKPRVYPVGRLDYDTSGLLILTNDGDFTYELTHPKFEKEKEYETELRIKNYELGIRSLIDKFKKGVRLKEGIARADKIRVLEEKKDVVKLSIVIHQGWNRQIRRMCEVLGLEVLELKRVRIGDIRLGELKIGEWRKMSAEEIENYF